MNLVGLVLFRHFEEKSAAKRRRRQHQAELVGQLVTDLRNQHREKKEAKAADEAAQSRGFRSRHHENWVLAEAEDMNEEFDRAREAESVDLSSVVEVATALLAGGESNADVATYLSGETGIPHSQAVAILMGIKGKLAVQAQAE